MSTYEIGLCVPVRTLFPINIQQKCAAFNLPHVSVFKNYLAKFTKSPARQSLHFPRDVPLTNYVTLARLWHILTQQKLEEPLRTSVSLRTVTRIAPLRQRFVH